MSNEPKPYGQGPAADNGLCREHIGASFTFRDAFIEELWMALIRRNQDAQASANKKQGIERLTK